MSIDMRFSSIFLIIFLFFTSNYVLAGQGGGKITRIYAHAKNNGTGVIFFAVENHANRPNCSGHEWAFDANTYEGKAMYSLLLSAAAQGKSVSIHGSGDCSAWADREKPYYIYVNY